MLQRSLPAGFIALCLPTKARDRCMEITIFQVIAPKDGAKLRLYSRPGNDLTYRFPLIVESV
jgi:hypothetical protein